MMLGGGENDDGEASARSARRPVDPEGEVYEPGSQGERDGGNRPRGNDEFADGYEDFINFIGGGRKGGGDPGRQGPGREPPAAETPGADGPHPGRGRRGGGDGPPHRLSSTGSGSLSVSVSSFGGSCAADVGSAPSDRSVASHGASATSLPPRVSDIATHRPRVPTREFTINKHEYDAKGRCVRHPNVRLRKKKAFGRGWKVLIHRCPECCLDELRMVKAEFSRSGVGAGSALPPTPEQVDRSGQATARRLPPPPSSLSTPSTPSDDVVACGGTMTWLTTDGDVLA